MIINMAYILTEKESLCNAEMDYDDPTNYIFLKANRPKMSINHYDKVKKKRKQAKKSRRLNRR